MRTNAAIQRYDRMFLRDLGSHPVYEWKWSEDIIHVMDAVDGEGNPIRETIATGILDAHGREIHLPGKQATRTRRFPGLWQQWVVCAHIELENSKDGQVYGTGTFAWVPVYDKRSRPACIPENLRPNQDHTEAFIRQLRRTRARDAEEMGKWEDFHKPHTVPMDESERNTPMISRAEKVKFENAKLAFKDKFTAFGEEPGKKGSTSFPKTPKEMGEDFADYRKDLDTASQA